MLGLLWGSRKDNNFYTNKKRSERTRPEFNTKTGKAVKILEKTLVVPANHWNLVETWNEHCVQMCTVFGVIHVLYLTQY